MTADTMTPVQPAAKAATPPPAARAAKPRPRSLAVVYSPELQDPMLTTIAGGAVVFAAIGADTPLVLNPGVNRVEVSQWQSAKDLPEAQELLALRVLEELELGEDGEDKPDGAPVIHLHRAPAATALRLVATCRSQEQLKAWSEAEERMTVRQAIQRRLQMLMAGAAT
jgi:hypothetical protein